MRARIGLLSFVAILGVTGCSKFIEPSYFKPDPSKYGSVELCDHYGQFLRGTLSMNNADVDTPTLGEEDGTVGWNTICHSTGKNGIIGTLQVHQPFLVYKDDPDEPPSGYRSVAGFDGKAWTGAPLPYWTEVEVRDGNWSAQMSFVKDCPEQELLTSADIQKVAEFLVQVADDLQR
ncbi:hypothetical protein [Nocardia sp. CC201C]|uniref:hypothetical protein n=1 Tax=Nocardia sp. CC201C TaxID=3044575 RepID=UPI0024A85B05|nr:hypothetical protein [Nocardia sp. CC201C]